MKILHGNTFMKIAIFLMAICVCTHPGKAQAYQWSDNQEMEIDSSGNAVVVWQTQDPISGNFIIQAAFYDALTTTWSSPVDISSSTVYSFTPKLAVNSSGDAVAIWIEDDLMGTVLLKGSIRPANSSFGTAATISDTNDLTILGKYLVDINDAGDIVATWGAFVDLTYNAVVRVATADVTSGTWNTPVTISP